MARPQKNNADYFSHDNDMRNDDKIKAVRRKFKHEGYSVWNMLLEKLCKSDGFTLDYSDINVELWSGDFEVEPEQLKDMILYFIHIDLLLFHDGMIFSETMISRFNPLLEKRKAKRGSNGNTKPETPVVSDDQNPHSIVKDSKVNNTLKEDEGLMEGYEIEEERLSIEAYKPIEVAIKLYNGFKKAFPGNHTKLKEIKRSEWIPPIRKLMEKGKHTKEEIFEIATWAIDEKSFWRSNVMTTEELESHFPKLIEKYKYERAKQKT
jgi:hypothetical protein